MTGKKFSEHEVRQFRLGRLQRGRRLEVTRAALRKLRRDKFSEWHDPTVVGEFPHPLKLMVRWYHIPDPYTRVIDINVQTVYGIFEEGQWVVFTDDEGAL